MIRTIIEGISGYPGLFAACAVSGLLVPMPEDVPLLYAGTRVAVSGWSLWIVLLVGVVSVGLRDVGAWWLGRSLGRRILRWSWLERIWSSKRMRKAEEMVRERGTQAVLMGRFLVGFRAPVFFAAGAVGVPLRSFVAVDTLGLLVAVPITVGLGWGFGEPTAEFAMWALRRVHVIGFCALLALTLGFGARSIWLKTRPYGARGHLE